MKKIDPVHLKKFYEVIEELNKSMPLDIANIHSVIEGKGKGLFPGREQTALIAAVNNENRPSYAPFLPIVCVTAAPNHLSEHAGILEFKIMNTLKQKDGIQHIAWLSVFPSGRMIFGMDGVFLDSNGKRCFVDRNTALRDHRFYDDKLPVRTLRKVMVESFSSSNESVLTLKTQLLALFSEVLPENN